MSVKIIAKKNKIKATGKVPLYMRITIDRKSTFYSLGVEVEPQHWDEVKSRVKRAHPNSIKVNNYLREEENKAEAQELEKGNVSAKKVKNQLLGNSDVTLTAFMTDYYNDLEIRGQIATYKRFKSVLNKMQIFFKKEQIEFKDFDLEKLKAFQKHLEGLKKKNKQSTIHANLRVIRKFYNLAIKEDIIQPGSNPFEKFTMPKESTAERVYLTEAEIGRLIALELSDGSLEDKCRDIYVLSTFVGLRISDLLQLKWNNFNGTHLTLNTQKTKSQLAILVPKSALKIIHKYQNRSEEILKTDFIFPCLKNGKNYDAMSLHNGIGSQAALLNRTLKVIGKKAEIDKNFSLHSGRHSFASNALRKGIRIEYVSKLLSHASLRTTSVYSHIVNKDLDQAMLAFNNT